MWSPLEIKGALVVVAVLALVGAARINPIDETTTSESGSNLERERELDAANRTAAAEVGSSRSTLGTPMKR